MCNSIGNTALKGCYSSNSKGIQGHLDTIQLTSESLNKRANRKAVTKAQMGVMIQIDSPLHKQYLRANDCSDVLRLVENSSGERKMVTHFCQTRFCNVCSAIRTAKYLQGYLQPVKQLSEKHFVTLTVPAVSGEELKSTIKKMVDTFTKVKDVLRKKSCKISGIRKLECNYNPKRNTYNPHFHFILSGRFEAEQMVSEWLSRYHEAVSEAQDIREADDNSLNELFKYQVKQISSKSFNPEQQDIIYRSLSGRRTLQPFGEVKKCPVTVDNDSDNEELLIEEDDTLNKHWRTIDRFYWNNRVNNWVSIDGEIISNVRITAKAKKVVDSINNHRMKLVSGIP